ncbi:MAG: hypothetical protein LH606_04965, partial [Cytophagaceae bacterium]|nr:hypothetical protein [Cytophagaceae bacterium]
MAYEIEDLRELVAELTKTQQETAQRLEETSKQMADEHKLTEATIRKVTKQIGEIGNKFGSFTEGMAFPSMERMLRRRFAMTHVATNFEIEMGGDTLEMDVFAYANGEVNTAIIVEVKSPLRERDVEQVLSMMEKFPRFFPEHRNKKLYGILAAVQVPA